MRAPARSWLALVIAAVLPVAASSGCASTSGSAAAAAADHAGHSTVRPGWDQFSTPSFDAGQCSHKYPGELMTAAEAVVVFSRQGICPGYVTVEADTAVRWRNLDTTAFTVTIRRDSPDGPVLDSLLVAPGATGTTTLGSGRYAYATDAIESFRGWVEVTGRAAPG